jgi:hypothetical protein
MGDPLPFADATDDEIRQWARDNLQGRPIQFVELNTLLPNGANTACIDWLSPGYPVARFRRQNPAENPAR